MTHTGEGTLHTCDPYTLERERERERERDYGEMGMQPIGPRSRSLPSLSVVCTVKGIIDYINPSFLVPCPGPIPVPGSATE